MSLDLELSELKQKHDEPLNAYYRRASTLLARMGAKNRGPNVSLSLIKLIMLNGVIRAFIRGIEDREIQKKAFRGLSAQDRSLRRIYTLADEARKTNLKVKKLVDEEIKTKELEYFRSLVLKIMSKAQLNVMLASG